MSVLITFRCLIVKSYKGHSKHDQAGIVTNLGGKQIHPTSLLWDIETESLEQIKAVETALRDHVPYIKLKGPSELLPH